MRPVFQHDHDNCHWLGHAEGHDLYYCTQDMIHQPTLIRRFGNEPYQYNSGFTIQLGDKAGEEAARRAEKMGYIETQVQFENKQVVCQRNEEGPRWYHGCASCHWLGRWGKLDLYFCKSSDGGQRVTQRSGPGLYNFEVELANNVVGTSIGDHALEIAARKGLYEPPQQEKKHPFAGLFEEDSQFLGAFEVDPANPGDALGKAFVSIIKDLAHKVLKVDEEQAAIVTAALKEFVAEKRHDDWPKFSPATVFLGISRFSDQMEKELRVENENH